MTEIPEDLAWVAERYDMKPRRGEPEENFRKRLADIILEEGKDPYVVVSILTGKDVNFVMENFMGDVYYVQQIMSAKQQALMVEMGDTHYQILYADALPIFESAGFEQVHHHLFEAHDRIQQFSIWAKHELGFLLSASSYIGLNEETLSSADLHYELNFLKPYEELTDGMWEMYRRGVKGSNGSPNMDLDCTTRLCSVDVRERFLGKLYEIERCGFPTNNPWLFFDDHYVGLLDHGEQYDKGLDKDARSKERLIALPDKTKIMMGIEELCN